MWNNLFQEELYDLILKTNKECMTLCKPGTSIHQMHNYSVWFQNLKNVISWLPLHQLLFVNRMSDCSNLVLFCILKCFLSIMASLRNCYIGICVFLLIGNHIVECRYKIIVNYFISNINHECHLCSKISLVLPKMLVSKHADIMFLERRI